MALTARTVVVAIPPSELLAFIQVSHTQLTLQTVLGTLVIYDAGALACECRASLPLITLNPPSL